MSRSSIACRPTKINAEAQTKAVEGSQHIVAHLDRPVTVGEFVSHHAALGEENFQPSGILLNSFFLLMQFLQLFFRHLLLGSVLRRCRLHRCQLLPQLHCLCNGVLHHSRSIPHLSIEQAATQDDWKKMTRTHM
jgi:hypothetical protein